MSQGRSKFTLSNLNVLKNLDARGRVIFLIMSVIGVVVFVYLGTRYLLGSGTTNHSSVAVPTAQSIPGQLNQTPQFSRALDQSNQQRARTAQISGTSAIPTQNNIGSSFSSSTQCVICSDQSADIGNTLDDWQRSGQIDDPSIIDPLKQLAADNVPVSQFADALDQLVRASKLTPQQALQLLEQYKKQHANALAKESAGTMDGLIKEGNLPLDVANQLLADQKKGMSPADYAKELQHAVQAAKITPETASQLLAQYNQQVAKQAAKETAAGINKMAQTGEVTSAVAKQLKDLADNNVPIDQYAAALQRDIADGKLTPAAAAKLLAAYHGQKAGTGPSDTLNTMAKAAADKVNQDVDNLVKTGQVSPETALQLKALAEKNATPDEYTAALNQLTRERKLSPEAAKKLLAEYQVAKKLQEEAARLDALQANNASGADYAGELKQAVLAGLLTPDEANQLMGDYASLTSPIAIPTSALPTGTGTDALAQLQQRVQQSNAANQASAGAPTTAVISPSELAATEAQAAQQAAQDRQARIDALTNAMSGQAQQLVNSAWPPPQMHYQPGTPDLVKPGIGLGEAGAKSAGSTTTTTNASTGAPIIKAGSILFAVLDTAINSDYPDSPVMATVVAGKFKGAKLLGKLTTTKGVSGQMDRVSLNFSLMNLDAWTSSKTVTAYAIDPDTARTVLASQVNYHYLQRFGAIMATSFLQGFGSAITNQGTSTTGIFGTSTNHPSLGTAGNIWGGLGQIGQTMGTVTQNYVNIPPTVKVDSGVGLGILFMSDLS